MSKMSKTIAILGVVAGLGVAALPLSSYAETVEWVEDGKTGYDSAKMGTDKDGNHYVNTGTEVTLEIADKLSIESSATGAVSLSGAAGVTAGLYESATPLTITVITKNAGGYNLTIEGAGDTTGGKKSNSMYNGTNDEIPAGNFTAADDTAATSAWGYGLAANATANPAGATIATAAKYQGVPDTATTMMSRTDTATTDAGDKVDVSFGANVISSQAAGTYTGKVTFTATNQPKTNS